MNNFVDLSGNDFGRLHVDSFSHLNKRHEAYFNCTCVCGNKTCVSGKNLKSGAVQSCGCLHRESLMERNIKHHGCGTRLYRIWKAMKNRCNNINNPRYIDYGGRKITVCDEWQTNFDSFRNWAYTNGYTDGLSIDRIDNSLGYSPDNCRWADVAIQANNKSNNHLLTFNGMTKTISQWSEIVGIKKATIAVRINVYKWSVERALTEPVKGSAI